MVKSRNWHQLVLLFRVCTFKTCSMCGHAPLSDVTAGVLAIDCWLATPAVTPTMEVCLKTCSKLQQLSDLSAPTINPGLNIQFSCSRMKEEPCSSDGGFGQRENPLPDSQEDVFRLRDKVRIHNHNTDNVFLTWYNTLQWNLWRWRRMRGIWRLFLHSVQPWKLESDESIMKTLIFICSLFLCWFNLWMYLCILRETCL